MPAQLHGGPLGALREDPLGKIGDGRGQAPSLLQAELLLLLLRLLQYAAVGAAAAAAAAAAARAPPNRLCICKARSFRGPFLFAVAAGAALPVLPGLLPDLLLSLQQLEELSLAVLLLLFFLLLLQLLALAGVFFTVHRRRLKVVEPLVCLFKLSLYLIVLSLSLIALRNNSFLSSNTQNHSSWARGPQRALPTTEEYPEAAKRGPSLGLSGKLQGKREINGFYLS